MLGLLLLFAIAQSHITVPIQAIGGFSFTSLSRQGLLNQTLSMVAQVENSKNLQYIANISIGTPGQKLSVLLDTGSSWLWLPGNVCNCHKSKHFNSTASSTYKSTNVTKILRYQTGTVWGNLSQETFQIDNKKAKSQYFISSYRDSDMDGLLSDGILGLGFNLLSENRSTFIESLYNQKVIKNKFFSLYLNNNNFSGLGSAFTIGGYNTTLYGTGPAKKVKIDSSSGYWLGVVQKFAIGSNSWSYSSPAYFDVGTSLILGPSTEVHSMLQFIISKTEGACYINYWYIECTCKLGKYEKYPDLVFTINNQAFTVSAKDYIYYESGYCYPLIDYSYDYYWIIGQPFFRAYYSVYDMQTPQILLYKAAVGKASETVPGPSEFYLLGISACGLIALAIGGFYYKNSKKAEQVGYTRLV